MPADLVIHEAAVAEIEIAGIVDCLVSRALARGQGPQRHQWLERRPGRIGAVDGAVEQRFVWMVVEFIPIIETDAINKQIGIESRRGHQCQHRTVIRIDGRQGAAPATERLLGHPLQACIQGQGQVIARRRRRLRQHPHGPPACIDLNLFIADGAMQLVFVMRFQPDLADMLSAFVVGLLIVSFDPFLVLGIDAADVPDRVCRQGTFRILAE